MSKELVKRACMERAILDILTEAAGETRDQLRGELDPGDRSNTDLGMAYVSQPKPRVKVVDEQAFFDWVEANLPDEIVTARSVSAGLRNQILRAGSFDGQPVDGIGTVEATPTLTVKPSDRAKVNAPMLLASILETNFEDGFPEVEA